VNDGGDDLGAIVFMEDFEIIRKFYNQKLLESMNALGAAMREEAEQRTFRSSSWRGCLTVTTCKRAFIDTNVFISTILFPRSTPAQAIRKNLDTSSAASPCLRQRPFCSRRLEARAKLFG